MNDVLAIVVTYNRLDMLKVCISRLLSQAYPCDILLVDNDSTDGTGDWANGIINKYYKPVDLNDVPKDDSVPYDAVPYKARRSTKVKAAFGDSIFIYENTGENMGGAGGFNYGMKRAYEYGYKYVWIMDDDAFVHETTLSELFEIDKLLGGPENYGYLASTVLWTDGTECAMNRHRIHKKYYRQFDKLQYAIIPVEASTFVSMLIPLSTIKKVGLPIKEYFIWGDDVEYTMRIAMMFDMPSYMVGKSLLTHAMKQNIGSDISVDTPDRFPNYKRAFRNENHTFREYGAKGMIRYIKRCGASGLKIFKYSKDRRLKRCMIICSQFIKGFSFNPEIEFLEEEKAKKISNSSAEI